MLPHSGVVLACVSGGADSMCLLHVLDELRPIYGFSLAAVHFNHRLRGDEADRDEAFVRDHCAENGIRFISGSGDVAAWAERNGLGIEEAAREMRYAFFDRTADETCAVRIATAHTADDNAETLLMNIARGSGSRGLAGIPPVRGRYIRPLLVITREDVMSFLGSRSVPHVEDSSNSGDGYTRNRLRHHVMPEIAGIFPRFSENALRACMSAREDDEFLDSLAEDFIAASADGDSVDAAALAALPAPVGSRVVRILAGGGISSAHVRSVLRLASSPSPSGSADIPGMTVCREYGRLGFGAETGVPAFGAVELVPGASLEIPEAGFRVTCEAAELPRIIHKSLTEFLFKTDGVCGTIVVRPRRTGDTLRPAGGGHARTLKKIFIEKRIPKRRRGLVPVVADDAGVLAVCGIGQDARAEAKAGDAAVRVRFDKL